MFPFDDVTMAWSIPRLSTGDLTMQGAKISAVSILGKVARNTPYPVRQGYLSRNARHFTSRETWYFASHGCESPHDFSHISIYHLLSRVKTITWPSFFNMFNENVKALYHWFFVRIRSGTDSLHKGPVMRKVFPGLSWILRVLLYIVMNIKWRLILDRTTFPKYGPHFVLLRSTAVPRLRNKT